MKPRGVIFIDFEEMSIAEAGDQERKLKEFVTAHNSYTKYRCRFLFSDVNSY
tara:strand:- start:565 stop:720 length:156 start_codon:yes stop_codon:yes gene_type:complete